MLKRCLIFSFFIILVIIVCAQSEELILSFYVLFPMLLFPLFLLVEDAYLFLFPAGLGIATVVYLVYVFRYPSKEMFLFAFIPVALAAGFLFYQKFWKKGLLVETEQCAGALSELETLKQKHHSRLESLHHLEKQVAGLLDLFEIARDFNDCLSFEAVANILGQKVMPELPFRHFRLILMDRSQLQLAVLRVFSIQGKEVKELSGTELNPEEWDTLEKIKATKKMLQSKDRLVFPLVIDGEMEAVLIIEGTETDDLAKFEVLSAYMTLQVKKIKLYETVKELSIRDGLTGVFVRRHFLERFDEEIKRCIKYNLSLAVLMLDIDHFKRYNDEYGHLAGDATLKQVSTLLRGNLRKVDVVARYGGEEFIIVLPEAQKTQAFEVAERIRSGIARFNFKVYNDQTRVTVSIGIALFPEDIPDGSTKSDHSALGAELIQKADSAMYRAKEEGRNRVVLYREI